MGTITLGAKTIYNALVAELSSAASQQTVDNLLRDLKESEGRSDYLETLSRLESIMNARNIAFERRTDDADYYIKLLSQYTFPSYDQMKYHMLHSIMSKMEEYYSPEMYMKRTVDHLEDPSLGWGSEPTRLRILRQFVKEGNALKDTGIKGDGYIRKYVKKKNDGIFKPLDAKETDDPKAVKATPNQRKADGTYGLLTICDDLAKGLFHKNGFTKRYLYYFGIVYGMIYYSEDPMEKYEKEKDIEAVLFEQYYVNNITRFLLEEYKADNNGSYEKDPSGQGINKKDYRELVWLYYLNREMPPAEKLKKSTEMIEKLRNSKPADPGSHNTIRYSTLKFEQLWPSYFALNEDVLLKRIPNDFDCTDDKTDDPEKSVSAQKTAFRVYGSILKELQKEGVSVGDCDYGMSIIIDSDIRSNPQKFLSKYKDITEEKLQDFLMLIGKFHQFISYPYLKVDSPEDIGRLKIMGLHYYLFVETNCELQNKDSFQTVCAEFERTVNEYLEKAGYPLFSIKNYFDILIAFAAFTAINGY